MCMYVYVSELRLHPVERKMVEPAPARIVHGPIDGKPESKRCASDPVIGAVQDLAVSDVEADMPIA